jgi:single-strand DNA-binding protein
MPSENMAVIIGNLGSDPDLRYTANQRAVAQLSVATNRVWTQDGERREEVTWHRVVVWGKQADAVALYLRKGSSVYVLGRLANRTYEDRDGVKRWTQEIVASRVQFLGTPNGGGARPPHPADAGPPDAGPPDAGPPADGFAPGDDDDIPF